MKKQLLTLALALIPMLGFSQHRSESDAIAVAQEFWGGSISRAQLKAVPQKAIASAKARVKANGTSAADSKQSFYVINDEEHGRFVIVSSDDRLYKILGYSDNGCFDADSAPEGLLEMLGEYDAQYTSVYTALDEIPSMSSVRQSVQAVEPLIKTKWGQNDPFNLDCPIDNTSSENKHCAVGCCATAMAQIMNYYQYPAKGSGTYAYTSTSQSISQSIDFASKAIDWNNMALEYNKESTETQKQAVAYLMHACGVSLAMNYGPSSGALDSDVALSLTHFWNYNPNISCKMKDYYSTEEWEKIINDELKEGHPMFYSGQGTGGHAFVLDGCDSEGYYHFNFGTNGLCDGYYTLEVIKPQLDLLGYIIPTGEDYSSNQAMVCYITPEKYGLYQEELYFVTAQEYTKVKVGTFDIFLIGVRNYNAYSGGRLGVGDPFDGEVGIGLFDKDFNFITSIASSSAKIEGNDYALKSLFLMFDAATFSEGKQYYWAMYSKTQKNGYTLHVNQNTDNGLIHYYLVTVKNGEVIFEPKKLTNSSTEGIVEVEVTSALSIVPTYGAVEIVSPTSTTINIYNLQGRIVETVNVAAGEKVTVPLASGIYVVGGKKVHVR